MISEGVSPGVIGRVNSDDRMAHMDQVQPRRAMLPGNVGEGERREPSAIESGPASSSFRGDGKSHEIHDQLPDGFAPLTVLRGSAGGFSPCFIEAVDIDGIFKAPAQTFNGIVLKPVHL